MLANLYLVAALYVPEYTWVTLAEAAKSANTELKAGEMCALVEGGEVETMSNGTAVRYALPASERAEGALCPDGAMVYLPEGQVKTWEHKPQSPPILPYR